MFKKEAIVLDKLKKEIKFKQTPVIQCIGTSNFSLLEIISDDNVKIQDKINTENKIIRKIPYNKLSNTAKKEIEKAIETIVLENTDKFVEFFNNAKPIGLRRHQLDLLPMIGKKHRMEIIEYIRKKGKFKSINEIKEIEMMPDPIKIIVNRILDEIIGGPEIKYNLFTIPFYKK
jgi:putative nucleotide binding protein